MTEANVHRSAAQIADRISWRDPEALVSGAVVVIFGVGYWLAYAVDAPKGSEQAIGQIQGAIIAALSSVVSYWLGSSRGARRNADRADKAMDVAARATEDRR